MKRKAAVVDDSKQVPHTEALVFVEETNEPLDSTTLSNKKQCLVPANTPTTMRSPSQILADLIPVGSISTKVVDALTLKDVAAFLMDNHSAIEARLYDYYDNAVNILNFAKCITENMKPADMEKIIFHTFSAELGGFR